MKIERHNWPRRAAGTTLLAAMVATALVVAGLSAVAAQGDTSRVSIHSDGTQGDEDSYTFGGGLSADARYVAFASAASNLVPDDTNNEPDVFVRDRQTGDTTRVSVSSNGAEGDGNSGLSEWPGVQISANGRYVAFVSIAANLVTGDTNNTFDVFVHDRQTGVTTRVSVDSGGAEGDGISTSPAISSDGRYVSFNSDATNLVPGDGNGVRDTFVHDRQTGVTTRVSVDSSGTEGDDRSWLLTGISANGRFVLFDSDATNLVPGDINNEEDVFVHDRQTGDTTRVSVDSNGSEGNDSSFWAQISANGRYVAFTSYATNLVSGDVNNESDVFVHDRQTGETTRISESGAGVGGDAESRPSDVSATGRYVVYDSAATNLVPDDTNGAPDLFVHDRQTGETTRASVASNGSEGDLESTWGAISGNGDYVAFSSDATNLVPGDNNGFADVFVHQYGGDPPQGTTTTTTTTQPSTTTTQPTTTTLPSGVDYFTDDDGHLFEGDINAIAADGITRGCNPPDNDNYCPDRTLTRAEAAAFVARALNLPAATTDWFSDDDGLTLEGEINRLAEAGITRGCNPPNNDLYCPDRTLTRAEAAAFLARALNLPVATQDWFADDNGLTLEGEINRLAEAGITRGCNPPDHDEYCPNDDLTRGEGAAFLNRAPLP